MRAVAASERGTGAVPRATTRGAGPDGGRASEGIRNGRQPAAYDDVIDPRDLRNALLAGLWMAEGREPAPPATGPTGILP
jgi:hypothetical protein